ncbi:MAG: ATP-binding protein [Actinomycetota bacterium]|nr:ATP-binding protein [Actinomycetota bacterium]
MSAPQQIASHGPTSAEALDLLPTGIVLADVSGRMVRRNAAADALVDSWEDGVLGRRIAERLADAVRPGAGPTREQVRVPGHEPRVFEVSVRPVAAVTAATGGSSGAVALFEDVTERLRVEAVRRDFVANVSHELKTPVGAISLLAEALEGERDPEVVERLTGRIGTEARRVSDLVEDLLDLRAIEEDSGVSSSVDLGTVASEVVDRVEPMAQRLGVAVEADLPTSDVRVDGVRTQLLSLVRNLVENGVKYSDEGGRVQVHVSKANGRALVRVSDDGVGIPASDHDRVFERFYRVDRARNRDTGGSGLGLSIVRNVVQGHGGTVDLESREGGGTTVTVRLPFGAGTPAGGTGELAP